MNFIDKLLKIIISFCIYEICSSQLEKEKELLNRFNPFKLCKNNIQGLIPSNVTIEKLSEKLFHNLNMDCLDLKARGINEITSGFFNKFPHLQVVNLENNQLNVNSFFDNQELLNVRILNLNDNKRTDSLKIIKGYYPKLNDLHLRNLSLKNLDLSLMTNLNNLILSGNDLSQGTLKIYKTVNSLILDDNKLKKLEPIRLYDNNNNNNITTLEIEQKLRILSLNKNIFEKIGCSEKSQSLCLDKLKNLNILFLSDNNIFEIESNAFNDNGNLILLDLSENYLEKLNENSLSTSLVILNLGSNPLTNVPKLCRLINLEILILDHTRILRIVDNDFCELKKLKKLWLRDVGIEKLSENSFGNLIALEELHLDDNKLSTLQGWQMPFSLRALHLGGNSFKILADATRIGTAFLEYLDLRRNQINDSDVRSFNISKLHIDFCFQTNPLGNDQQLTEELRSLVGDSVFGYDKLLLTWCQKQHPDNVSLDLSGLELKRLSDNVISSHHVICLDLQNNKFQYRILFQLFYNQRNLEYLNLAKTDSFSSSLENLQILSLSTNNIDSIDSNTFDNLLSLIVLDLSGNQISNLEYRSTFNLQYLILTNNTISSMDNIQLGNNTTLEYLVLVNNPLMSITPKMLQFLPDDTTIKMGFLLQLFGLVIITLCFDFGESFQTNPLGNDQQLTEELQSLVGDAVFGYDELSLTWCQKQHPDNVSLDLSELGIRNLPKNFISSQHVTCLDLQNNEFENRTEFNIFKKQPNLEYLNLAKTNVNLQYLLYDASHPKIKTLVLDRASNYRFNENEKVLHLRFPNLENLSLQQLNYHNSYNPHLSYIDFSSTKLTHLFLSNNNIPKLNDQFFEKFPSTLTHLFLERCNLNSYSSSINQTASIISLSMDGNKFSCSNGGCLDFENHPELKCLSLANCKIISLSHNTFLSNLKLIHLDLSGNQIQQLSERTFLKTPALESLNLNDNQLWKIPNLHSLINLKNLYVKNNQITNLDKDSFSSLENLQILSLSTNNIDSIDSNTFDNLLSLIVLDLSGNQISNLEYRSTFNLQYLILTNNTISSMDNIQLGNNTTLEYLVLVNNPLMSITPKMFQFLPDDTTIVLKEKSTVS
ncbi:chaoptin-like [Leptopilina boulardi]|uniref:chaoptin-like n=1 Tax=Leptopilina boulardi TaxID=63433 RepID=UPI0021F60D62|nr:chaoptin-like [Leptopilina boulardi]